MVLSDAKVTYENKGEKEMTVFTPIIAVLCVVISFLGLLLFVGFITEPGGDIYNVLYWNLYLLCSLYVHCVTVG